MIQNDMARGGTCAEHAVLTRGVDPMFFRSLLSTTGESATDAMLARRLTGMFGGSSHLHQVVNNYSYIIGLV